MRNPCLIQRSSALPCWFHVPQGTEVSLQSLDIQNDSPLPADPRLWSRAHVSLWLVEMAKKHNLPDVKVERFPMNGKALCLMTVDMFISRVPVGGKLLFKDFQCRLATAIYSL
ncbi:ets DNA-binding protein pokkuri-like [Artemia franciscana]|uniref:PNT domain-containing protein n=1 Tax=Artemia franciscana TaxID=6661 RepID=A0AA88L3Y0_ARTSF|nr:hypothetical protein QYM36_006659 [Artemia franciscana]